MKLYRTVISVWMLLTLFGGGLAHGQVTRIPRSILDLIDAPRHVDVKKYGVKPSATATINATGINLALATYDNVYITTPGTYLVNASILFKSNNSLFGVPGVTLKLANTTRTYLARSNNFAVGSSAAVSGRLTNIRIEGIEFDINGANNAAVATYPGWYGMGSLFRGVDGLTIKDCRFLSSPKYCVWVSDCTDVLVENIYFNTTSDGIHFAGPQNRVVVRRVRGTCGDDVVPFGTSEWGSTDVSRGDLKNILVEDVDAVTTAQQVRFWGDATYDIRNITVRNVRGQSGSVSATGHGVSVEDAIWNPGDPVNSGVLIGPADVDNVLIEDVKTNVYDAFGAVRLSCTADRITVRNVQPVNVASSAVRCEATVNIKSLILDGIQTPTAGTYHGISILGGTISRLKILNSDFRLSSTWSAIQAASGATIPSAIVSNCQFSTSGTGSFYRHTSTNTSLVQISNCYLINTGASSPAMLYSGGNVEFQTNNITTENPFTLVSCDGNNVATYWHGNGLRRFGGTLSANPYSRVAGTLRINNPDAPVNLSGTTIVTPTVGDRALSTTAGGMQIGNGLLYAIDIPHWWNGLDWQPMGAKSFVSAAIAVTPGAGSVAAGAVYTVDLTLTGISGMNSNWSVKPMPAAIEAGLVWSCFVVGTSSVRLRIANPTGAAISTVANNWRFAVTDRQ